MILTNYFTNKFQLMYFKVNKKSLISYKYNLKKIYLIAKVSLNSFFFLNQILAHVIASIKSVNSMFSQYNDIDPQRYN